MATFVFDSLQKLLHSSRKLSLQVLNFVHSFQVRSSNPHINHSAGSFVFTLLLVTLGCMEALMAYLPFLEIVNVLSTL